MTLAPYREELMEKNVSDKPCEINKPFECEIESIESDQSLSKSSSTVSLLEFMSKTLGKVEKNENSITTTPSPRSGQHSTTSNHSGENLPEGEHIIASTPTPISDQHSTTSNDYSHANSQRYFRSITPNYFTPFSHSDKPGYLRDTQASRNQKREKFVPSEKDLPIWRN
jgi:hypothetical protein